MKLIKELGMIYPTNHSKNKVRMNLYECPDCELEFRIAVCDMNRRKLTKCRSCGQKTHGKSHDRIYKTWADMIARCHTVTNSDYYYYGKKGITVCDEWRYSFEAFDSWAISNGYDDSLTIDRIDSYKNYEPNNCRFATMSVQNRNKRRLQKNNTSKYRGVSLSGNKKKYVAQIRVDKIPLRLGTFDYPWTAAYIYDSYILNNNLEHTRNFNE